MTVHIPRWLLAVLVVVALAGVAVGGYALGRSSVEAPPDRYSEGYSAAEADAAAASKSDDRYSHAISGQDDCPSSNPFCP